MPKNWLKPDWPAPANVHAATTLRADGVSTGVYASLNLALHVGDEPSRVNENRARIKQMLNLPSEPVWLEQVHGATAVQAEQVSGIPQADASVTRQARIVCGVLTADCLPVIFCTLDGQGIAAAHAGWRGLLAGVLENTLTVLESAEVMVWLGPAIGPRCFQVGAEVRDAFVHKNAAYVAAFNPQDATHFLADIYQLAKIALLQLGVEKVYGGDFCTVTEQARFYSYRRDKQTGRMATLIWRD